MVLDRRGVTDPTCYDGLHQASRFQGGIMPVPLPKIRQIPMYVVAIVASLGAVAVTGAQSQEPKPVLPATPVAESDLPALETGVSGVSGSAWEGPNWGVHVSWDPDDWTVEGESIVDGYDGLQIGTPVSTVYIEAYEGFGGDPAACFADAERDIGEREGVSEVVPVSGKSLPVGEDLRGEARLFGLTMTLTDGAIVRAVEYVECRTILPGVAVMEITWQTVTGGFDEQFPLVEELLASIEILEEGPTAATPTLPRATPVD